MSASVIVGEVAGGVALEVVIAVPPERVFRALTSAEELPRFLPEFRDFEFDARVGGSYRFSRRDEDGSSVEVGGGIVELDPPHCLVLTWRWKDSQLPETRVRFTLDPVAEGTRLSLLHTGFAPEHEEARGQHEQHWSDDLELLREHVERDRRGSN